MLIIKLDPHWLSGIYAWKKWLSRQRYAILLRFEARRNTRAWLKAHGGVAKTETMEEWKKRTGKT